ncbi:MAG: hypothetical protein RBQ99_09505 [Trichlorobacter sp.]|nr:hypothetical protein [Trichlorobacter sp.]
MGFKISQVAVVLVAAVMLAGCQDRPENKVIAPSENSAVKAVAENADEKTVLESYLKSIRQNDKKAMYTLSNLTPKLVDESRLLLINQNKDKPETNAIADAEVALGMSGSVDFYLKKLPLVLLPKADVSFVKAVAPPEGSKGVMYVMQVSYPDAANAVQDKDGKTVKTLHLKMGVLNHDLYSGVKLQQFVVDSADFANLLGGEFDVQEYW